MEDLHLPCFCGAGGQLYHIKWTQDEAGALRLQDYWKDPVSAALSSSSSEVSAEAVRKSSSASSGSSANLAQQQDHQQ